MFYQLLKFCIYYEYRSCYSDLIDRIIKNEISGILNWAIQGLKRLLKKGKITIPPSGEKLLAKYKKDSKNVLMFIDDRCNLGENNFINRTVLYNAYKKWIKENGHRFQLCANKFYNQLEFTAGLDQSRTPETTYFKGIELKNKFLYFEKNSISLTFINSCLAILTVRV